MRSKDKPKGCNDEHFHGFCHDAWHINQPAAKQVHILLFCIWMASVNLVLKSHLLFWWIWMNFRQSFTKCSILTPDIRKQPQTSSESI